LGSTLASLPRPHVLAFHIATEHQLPLNSWNSPCNNKKPPSAPIFLLSPPKVVSQTAPKALVCPQDSYPFFSVGLVGMNWCSWRSYWRVLLSFYGGVCFGVLGCFSVLFFVIEFGFVSLGGVVVSSCFLLFVATFFSNTSPPTPFACIFELKFSRVPTDFPLKVTSWLVFAPPPPKRELSCPTLFTQQFVFVLWLRVCQPRT